jgi:hypothetical protein
MAIRTPGWEGSIAHRDLKAGSLVSPVSITFVGTLIDVPALRIIVRYLPDWCPDLEFSRSGTGVALSLLAHHFHGVRSTTMI